MVQSIILPGCRGIRQADEVQFITCGEKNTYVSLPVLTVSSTVRQHFCDALFSEKNGMSLKSEDKGLNLVAQSATA